MARQSISFTEPNDKWLKAQIDSKEYSSKSEVINDLIRKAREKEREIELIRAKLIQAEQGGFTELDKMEILNQSKAALRGNGEL